MATPRMGSTKRRTCRSSRLSRSSAVTVMPTAEPCEETFVTVQMEGFFPLCSPDQQQKLPPRTENWGAQDSVMTPKEHLQHFPTDAFSDSSTRCAADPIGMEGPKSTSTPGPSAIIATASAVGDGDDESYRSSEKFLAAPNEANFPTKNLSQDSVRHRSPQEVLRRLDGLIIFLSPEHLKDIRGEYCGTTFSTTIAGR